MKNIFLILFQILLTPIYSQTYVLRYDDFSNFSRSRVDNFLLNIHDSVNVPINIGIVPWSAHTRESNDYRDLEMGKVSVWNDSVHIPFIHGLTHTKRRENSEFVGGLYEVQFNEIRESKSKLDSIFLQDILCWSAPFNSYDSTSLSVCKDLGFQYVFCSSKHGPVVDGLSYIPSTVGLMDFFKFPNKMIFDFDDTVVIQFHDYNFDSEFSQANYADWLIECITNGVNFEVFSEAGISSERYRTIISNSKIKEYVPYFLLPKECFQYGCEKCLWKFLRNSFITVFILGGLPIYGVLRYSVSR
jgi:hypothetical protein